MNREEIIRAMRSACDKDKVDAWQNDFWTITQEELERFAALIEERAAAAEREACAKECEETVAESWMADPYIAGCVDCAAAIRARGN